MCVGGGNVVSGCEYVVVVLLMSGIGAMLSCRVFEMFVRCVLDFCSVLANLGCGAIVELVWRFSVLMAALAVDLSVGSSEYSVGVRSWAISCMSLVLGIVFCGKWLFWYVSNVLVLGISEYSMFVNSWAIVVS